MKLLANYFEYGDTAWHASITEDCHFKFMYGEAQYALFEGRAEVIRVVTKVNKDVMKHMKEDSDWNEDIDERARTSYDWGFYEGYGWGSAVNYFTMDGRIRKMVWSYQQCPKHICPPEPTNDSQ
eukprot:CAMPEP_0184313558 /NCGR_PEP_ID=MMETSP1049-20130417/64899_1 /TAXON_ID=77928 /ORGANISM="Proteomonas sulcata, Strain CCMP704" /LENGTH=123 /DNA_ID=CAMNT_0026630903 /DNA_START=283 /DNA_END=654 /DNA_ORIENTATION=+